MPVRTQGRLAIEGDHVVLGPYARRRGRDDTVEVGIEVAKQVRRQHVLDNDRAVSLEDSDHVGGRSVAINSAAAVS